MKKSKKSPIEPEILEPEVLEAEVIEAEVVDSDHEEDEINEADIIDVQKVTEELLPALAPSRDLAVPDTGKLTDPLTKYLREISRYKLLSKEQEEALSKALYESGDIEIAKQLVMANLRLVVKIAMEYRYAYSNVMDLIQEGNIGLMKAVSKYDPYKGAKLSYYASWWIKSYILKFILDNFRLIKIGTTNEQKKLFYNLLKEKDRLTAMGITPDTKAISESLGVSEKSVKVMEERLSSSGAELSLDKPLKEGDGNFSLSDILPDSNASNIEEELGELQSLEILKENLSEFIGTLKPRDKEIFEKRLLSEIPPSLQSIADDYGVSRERIRQIEERLLKSLKVYMSDLIR